MNLLISITLVIVITVIPVMVAASLVGARHTGFLAALLAVVLQAGLVHLINYYIPTPELALIAHVIGGAAVFAVVLGTTLIRGLAVGVLFALFAYLIAMFVARVLDTSNVAVSL
jgi:hypothetical protein